MSDERKAPDDMPDLGPQDDGPKNDPVPATAPEESGDEGDRKDGE